MLYLGRTNQILCIKNISIETMGNFESYLVSDGFEVKEVLADSKIIKSQNLTHYDVVFILGGQCLLMTMLVICMKRKN